MPIIATSFSSGLSPSEWGATSVAWLASAGSLSPNPDSGEPSPWLQPLRKLAADGHMSMVCIDEAHYVNQHGRDFRPEFHSALAATREVVARSRSPVPIVAMSATMREEDRMSVRDLLRRKATTLIHGPLDRCPYCRGDHEKFTGIFMKEELKKMLIKEVVQKQSNKVQCKDLKKIIKANPAKIFKRGHAPGNVGLIHALILQLLCSGLAKMKLKDDLKAGSEDISENDVIIELSEKVLMGPDWTGFTCE